MRWIFCLLIVANIVLGTYWFLGGSDSPTSPHMPSSAPPLFLLSERPQPARVVEPVSSDAVDVSAPPSVSAEAPTDAPEKNMDKTPVTSTEKAVADKGVTKTQSVVSDAASNKSALEKAVTKASQKAPVFMSCFSVGPIGTSVVADRLATALRAKGATVRAEKRVREVKDYWVFVPPLDSREKAELRLKELSEQGFSGFVVKEGVFANAISLNHFAKREYAESYLQKLRVMRVLVELREGLMQEQQTWLRLQVSDNAAEVRAFVDGQISVITGVKRENTVCDASSD